MSTQHIETNWVISGENCSLLGVRASVATEVGRLRRECEDGANVILDIHGFQYD